MTDDVAACSLTDIKLHRDHTEEGDEELEREEADKSEKDQDSTERENIDSKISGNVR